MPVINEKLRQNYRLPTEAEWENACRSGERSQTYCGSNDANSVAWYSDNAINITHDVGQKQANGFGFYDMSGNVWEWVQDKYGFDYYSNSPKTNPEGPSNDSFRVHRGGSWNFHTSDLRSSTRRRGKQNIRRDYLGFRLARTR